MKAIHVLRKPLSEPTVVANVLTHGTGALNIDATRITGEGASPAIARRASAGRAGVVPGNPVSPTGWHNRTDLATYTAERVGGSIGRWPANLVLQHLEGCVQAGVRKVKGDGRAGDMAKSEGGSGGIWAKSTGTPAGALYGTETVAAWSCAEGCPVAVLDAQGGNSTSPSMVTRGGLRGMSFGMGRQEDVPCYGDTGGASRFFKQFGGKSE